MPGYTNISKPTSSTYTLVTGEGRRIYDDAGVTFDDADTFYDGYNPNAYTNLSKPTSSVYTNIAKPV